MCKKILENSLVRFKFYLLIFIVIFACSPLRDKKKKKKKEFCVAYIYLYIIYVFFFSKKEIILIANRLFLILNSYFLIIFYNGYDEFPAVGNENKRKR